ncbi:lipopolysaccharide biosynthesis protein, partial [Acidiplasma sp.]|uniref:lipopolysaccharide biosynthesis protein n=1 Tax=Acidiplasma sp. TaxID=1872114 RepID=UPI0031623A88
KTIIKKYITLALPLAASSIIATISGNIDKVLIQFFWHASATGVYAALQRITMPIITFSMALSVFFIPLLTREETKNGFNDNISVFERTISLFILPLVIIFIALRIFVANLWSANLIPYSTLLIFMSLANYLNVINSPYTSGLIVRGLTINIGKITLISISSNIILDFILIPKSIFGITFFSLGVIGAAVATFIAMIIEAVLFRFYVIKIEKSKINMKIFRQIIPASVQFIFLYLVAYYVRPYSVFLFLIFSIISIAIFFSLSIKMGEIKKSVIIDFIRELNPFKLSRTLKNE